VSSTPAASLPWLTRGLCAVILVAMIAAVAYATWIGVLNFSRIGV
jgi:hypothetical protein